MSQSPLGSWDACSLQSGDATDGMVDIRARDETFGPYATHAPTKMIERETLAYIRRNLFGAEDFRRRKSSSLPEFHDDLLPGTTDSLESSPEYQTWINQHAPYPSVLLISGEAGSGKSCFVEALKKKLDATRSLSQDGVTDTYVASYRFIPDDFDYTNIGLPRSSALSNALKDMALQIASQSLIYAKALQKQLQSHHQMSLIQDPAVLWLHLGLAVFEVPQRSTLYLLFDGLEATAHERSRILEFADMLFARYYTHNELLNLRILLTGTKETLNLFRLPLLEINTITKSLIYDYAIRHLECLDIFQDRDESSCANRQCTIETLTAPWLQLTFRDIRQNLQRLRKAIDQNQSRDCLYEILSRCGASELRRLQYEKIDATHAVIRTALSLSQGHIAELNSILGWTVYTERPLTIQELEAVLWLEREAESLEPLTKKITHRYKDILEINMDYVVVREDVKVYLHEMGGRSLDLTIDSTQGGSYIHTNNLNAQRKIVHACLNLLNTGWNDQTKALVTYARDYLPKHLNQLLIGLERIPSTDITSIGQKLVALLSNPQHLLNDKLGFGNGKHWLGNPEFANSVQKLLQYTLDEMLSLERGWAQDILNDPRESSAMHHWAYLIGQKWLEGGETRDNETPGASFAWLDNFYEAIILNGSGMETHHDPADSCFPDGLPKHAKDVDIIWKEKWSKAKPFLTDGNDNSSEPVVAVDRIERMLDWLQKQNVEIKRDGKFHMIIGATYCTIKSFSLARKHFEIACQNDALRKYALFKLATTMLGEDDKVKEAEGIRLMCEAIKMISPEFPETSHLDMNLYLQYMVVLGDQMYCRGRPLESIKVRKELLKHQKDDHKTRYEVFRCLCIWGDGREAAEFAEQWQEEKEFFGSKTFAEYFCEMASEYYSCECFESFYASAMRNNSRLSMVLAEVLSDAVNITSEQFDRYCAARPGVIYYHGLAMLLGTHPNRRELAREAWEEALYSQTPTSGNPGAFDRMLLVVATKLVRCKFDDILNEIQSNPDTTMERKIILQQEFTDYINSPVISRAGFQAQDTTHNPTGVQFGDPILSTATFLRASLMVLVDDLQGARNFWSADMKRALKHLTRGKENSDDYHTGIYWLLRSFPTVKDKIGLLTAFSLADRLRRRIASTDFCPSDEVKSTNATADVGIVDEQPKTVPYKDGQHFHCSSCSTTLNSWDPRGIWMCMFCETLELCSDCHRKFKSDEGLFNLGFCNPIHEYVHLVHTDYTDEEDAPGKVLIDWEYEQTEEKDDGAGFVRKGGRVVNITEWVDMLREEWKIPYEEKKSPRFHLTNCGGGAMGDPYLGESLILPIGSN